MSVAFHVRGYVFPLKARLGDILGCDPPDKGFRSVGNPPEEFSSDLENGARISEVDSGVLERAVGGSRGGRNRGAITWCQFWCQLVIKKDQSGSQLITMQILHNPPRIVDNQNQ